MGVRLRSATPGTILCLAATALLAVVSFNTPLLKSLYFLEATYSSGQYAGSLKLGTLGFCLTDAGAESCTGPQVGYEFDPNTLFGITLFNIPKTITKYLTYTLILHIIALAAAGLATLFGLLSHISSLSVWCFPTCFASIASSISLLALVFDLVIFYIAKARIDDVSGASASIGISVWLVLAAWLLAGFGGCAYGIGNCCMSKRSKREPGDPKADYYSSQNQPDDMRLQALRDEQLRKKEQGLPNFQEWERTPLTADAGGVGVAGTANGAGEDRYLYEDQPNAAHGGLRRDGSVLAGVGLGYGRRKPNDYQEAGVAGGYGYDQADLSRRGSGATAGNAGLGAGPGGVDVPNQGYGGYYGNAQNNYYDYGYNDPYQQQPYPDQNQNGTYDPYANQSHQYPPAAATAIPIPTPTPGRSRSAGPGAMAMPDPYASANTSAESHYPNLGPQVQHAQPQEDPYGGYDDGLGAIGMAATSPQLDQGGFYHNQSQGQNHDQGQGYAHARDGTYGYGNEQLTQPYGGGGSGSTPLHVPTPQHLITTSSSAQNLLRSPISPGPEGGFHGGGGGGQYNAHNSGEGGYDDDNVDSEGNRPPSYGAIAGASANVHGGGGGYPNEKSGYR